MLYFVWKYFIAGQLNSIQVFIKIANVMMDIFVPLAFSLFQVIFSTHILEIEALGQLVLKLFLHLVNTVN